VVVWIGMEFSSQLRLYVEDIARANLNIEKYDDPATKRRFAMERTKGQTLLRMLLERHGLEDLFATFHI
jgi:hypothetical protein